VAKSFLANINLQDL